MVDGLNAMDGVRCLNPEGAFYVFPNFSGVYGKSFDGNVIKGSIDLAGYVLMAAPSCHGGNPGRSHR
jgi:aspartate aminotransferase